MANEQSQSHVLVSNTNMKTKTKQTKQPIARGNAGNIALVKHLADKIDRVSTQISNLAVAKQQKPSGVSGLGKLTLGAGNAISEFFGGGKIFGQGAYKMTGGNTSWSTASQVPVMHSTSENVVLRKREYLGEITSSGLYSNQQTYSVNPGLPATFPFLSQIATCFQEYRFRGLVFEFKSTSAEALGSTSTALGSVMLVAQYRSDEEAPNNKTEILNEMWSASGKPSQNVFLPIECDPKESPLSRLYVRDGGLSVTQDQKFYDLATVYVATSGMQTTGSVIGEMWVTYDIELYKPSIPKNSNNAGYTFAGITATTANPSGVPGYEHYYNLNIVRLSPGTGTDTFTWPTGHLSDFYLVEIVAHGATAVQINSLTYTNGAPRLAWHNATQNNVSCGFGTTDTIYSAVVMCTSDILPMVLNLAIAYTGAGWFDLKVVKVSDDYY